MSRSETESPTPSIAAAPVGSDLWVRVQDLGADDRLEFEWIDWGKLSVLASDLKPGIPCSYHDRITRGKSSLVRRLDFQDGYSMAVKVRCPAVQVEVLFRGGNFGLLEHINLAGIGGGSSPTAVEYAVMKTFEQCPESLFPHVFCAEWTLTNTVGSPWIIMHYIHGTTAEEMAEIKQCEAGIYGDVNQDHSFRQKLAEIQARISSCKCLVAGSPSCLEQNNLAIGPDVHTGSGPWKTSEDYYRHLTEALIEEAANKGHLDNGGSPSFELPGLLYNLVKTYSMPQFELSGFPSAHRDLGAHNILVDDRFNIVGIVGLKDVAAVPPEMAAQYPPLSCMKIDLPGVVRNLCGVVDAAPHALDQVRQKCLNDKHRQHQQWFMEVEAMLGEQYSPVGRRFGSVAALVSQAMLRCSELDDGEKGVWFLAGQKLLATCPGPCY